MIIFYRNGIRRQWMYSVVIVLLLFSVSGICLVEYIDAAYLNYSLAPVAAAPQGEVSIVIKTQQRVLELYDDGKLFKRYRIAVGKAATPTPIGEWEIKYKGQSPEKALGTRWMGLDISWGSYGIHGTNMPWSIGYFASHGCIRMRNQDVEELYEWVPLNTPVRITGSKEKVRRTLRKHAVGTDVVILQLKLVELGYYQERADGCFGWETEAALRAFQRDHRLPETGVTDEKTLNLLQI